MTYKSETQNKNIAWFLPRPKKDRYKGGMPLYCEEWLVHLAKDILELDGLKIEISVLSPRKKIQHKDEIILGTHGIFMKKGSYRGTLLPQVAIHQNWTVDEFLGNCAKYKAGLGWDGWKSAELYTYEAVIFTSDDLKENC